MATPVARTALVSESVVSGRMVDLYQFRGARRRETPFNEMAGTKIATRAATLGAAAFVIVALRLRMTR